jgi:hypothetical protein
MNEAWPNAAFTRRAAKSNYSHKKGVMSGDGESASARAAHPWVRRLVHRNVLFFHCNERCKIEDGVPPFWTVVAELLEHLQVLLS